ncbi:MAG: glycosyltransferase family 2 protein [Candidatus Eiseniibacteriota bacterium]
MSEPRLSICIATLNRAGFIGATLDAVIAQATDEVEIVVVDGASSDRTPEVVGERARAFARLRYVRLDQRGGVDQDFCRAVENARGEFCWLMADDDLVKPGAISAVLAATRRGAGLIIVNAEVRNADLSRLVAARRLPFESDRGYPATEEGRNRLLEDAGDYLSFIGGVVIRRAWWEASEPQRYFGTEFVHVGVIFQAALREPALILAEPWIVIRYGNAQWTSRYFQIWAFKWPGLIWSLPGFPDEVRRRVSHPRPWRRPGALLLYRARGVYSLTEYRRWIEPQGGPWWSRWTARAIAAFPGCGANAIAALYARARHYRPLLIDLKESPYDVAKCWTRWTRPGRGAGRPAQ